VLYPVDVTVEASERPNLLRDVLEVFSRDKLNVIAAQTRTARATTWLTLTVEVPDSAQLGKALAALTTLSGVRAARRR
jgi:GTP pyrophosphokinase